MRVMAFDYGTKRVGIAVTDPLQIVANALTTLHPDQIWPFLQDYLAKEPVERFIVGKPVQLDGSPSQSTPHVVGFVRKLRKTFPDIPIQEMDERFTSKMASATILQSGLRKEKRKDKALVDTISATILLQDYLSSKTLF